MNKQGKKWQKQNMKKQAETKEAAHTAGQSVVHLLSVSLIVATVWAYIRWSIFELDLFPTVKNEILDCWTPVALALLTHFICRHDIAALNDRIERFGFFVSFLLSFLLIFCAGYYIVSRSVTYYHVKSLEVVPKEFDQLLTGNYILVDNICADTSQITSYAETSTRRRGRYHTDYVLSLYETCPLRSMPNLYVGCLSESTHDYTLATKEQLRRWRSTEVIKLAHTLERKVQGRHLLKRLTPHDKIEGFQKAARRNTSGSQAAAFYEITDKNDMERPAWPIYLWWVSLTVGAVAIMLLYRSSYVPKEYEESLRDSIFKDEEAKLSKLVPYLLLAIVPLLCIIVFLSFILKGYSTGNNNIDLFIQWGAISHDLVVEQGQWWRLVNSVFLHDGLSHLLGNLMGLFICYIVLTIKGQKPWWLLAVTLLSGIISGLFVVLFGSHTVTLGASGAVFGLYGYWLVAACKAREKLYFPLGLVGINLLISMTNGVSMSAHVGGLVCGIALALIMWKRLCRTI